MYIHVLSPCHDIMHMHAIAAAQYAKVNGRERQKFSIYSIQPKFSFGDALPSQSLD